MSDKAERKFNMSSVEFTQYALHNHVAPPSLGSIKARLRHASRKLGWSQSRTRECWYGYERVRISAEEIHEIEEKTGLRYGREELRTNQDLIDAATALLVDVDPNFHGAFVAALRALAGAFNRSGNQGDHA